MIRSETAWSYNTLLKDLAIQSPSSTSEYYAVTLVGDEQGRIFRSMFSHWIDFADKDRRVEVRAASIVRAESVVATWRRMGERCLVVESLKDLEVFFLSGGHAVVEKYLSESEIGEWLEPTQVVADGLLGFTSVCGIPRSFQNRAPPPKLRMKILKRDGYGCRICGRKPTQNSDIELHVHHIRPWAEGGVTTERNLITLCHTCHNGLAPHYEPTLHHMVDPLNTFNSVPDHVAAYNEGVRLYGINNYRGGLRDG